MPQPRLPLPLLLVPALLLVGLVGAAGGQIGPLQQRLARATTLTCSFSALATGTWTSGTPEATVGTSTFSITFTEIDADDGTAEASGRFGGVPVVVRYVNDYLHLMQMHSAGPLYTTTVLARESREGRLMAVHTRHEFTEVSVPGFTSRPEMYIGDCEIGE
jgi:hypothetical protein